MQSREKLTLGMDTSGSPLLLTVKKGDKIFSVRRKGVKQEKLLFPALESLLAKAGAQMEDIGQIFIIRGHAVDVWRSEAENLLCRKLSGIALLIRRQSRRLHASF